MSKTIDIVLALQDKCSPKLKEIADKIGITEKKLKIANKTITDFSNNLGSGFVNAAKVVGAGMPAVSAAIGATITKTTEQGDKIDKMSKKMQMSRQTFQELDYIFSQNDVDISTMQTGMSNLSKVMDEAKIGTKANGQTFQDLGISLKDTQGRIKSTENVMFEALDKLQKMPECAEKSSLAMQLFGKSAIELAPLLNGSAKGVSELRQKFKDLGMGMSDEVIEASVKYKDTMDSLNRSFYGIVYSVGAEFLPIVQQIAENIQVNMPQIREAIMPVIQGIGNAIKFVTNNMKVIIPIVTASVSAFATFKIITVVAEALAMIEGITKALISTQGIYNALLMNCTTIKKADYIWTCLKNTAQAVGDFILKSYCGTQLFAIQLLTAEGRATIMATIATKSFAIAQNIANIAMKACPLLAIIGGVILLIKGLRLLDENWENVTASIKRAVEAVKTFLHIKPKDVKVTSSGNKLPLQSDTEQSIGAGARTTQNDGVKVKGLHANGLDYVPFDNYIANLHKDEAILTADGNKTFNQNTTNSSTNKQITVNFYGDIIGDESFLQKLENRFTSRLRAELGAL